MQQLTQKLKTGKMLILEVPLPSLQRGQLLIKHHFSLISAGTEASTVKAARKGYIGKAKERPQQVKQVIDVVRSQGPVQAYRAVMKKLDAYSPLGYSCVGEVIDINQSIKQIVVDIRKNYKLKLPDAIIIASSIYYEQPIISADSDFKKVKAFVV